jgi:hypothetical protein
MPWIWHFFFSPQEILRDLIFLACLIVACFVPRFADRAFHSMEEFGSRLAERKQIAVFVVFFATILIRLSVLWIYPIPYPQIHDEFSYLLAADTYAHGRLANSTHPMWIYFDTFHVNQQPAYVSKYPPAQGVALAMGQLLGNPWLGVLLSGAAMCAAVLWMLQGWFPPRWALLGTILVMFKVTIFSYWMNSYLGGFVSAIGGALVMGALPRILSSWRAATAASADRGQALSPDGSAQAERRCLWNAIVMALGVVILANSRPYEGAFFCLPVFFVLVMRFFARGSSSWRVTLSRAVAPLCLVIFLGIAFMGYYNWRSTGKPTVFPYTVNEKTYMTMPTFVWQKMRPAHHYSNPQFEDFYNGSMRRAWLQDGVTSVPKAARKAEYIFLASLFFFLWPQLSVTVLTLGRMLRDRRVRVLLVQAALVFSSFLLARAWFNLHYAGELVATIFALATQGLRHIRRWEFAGRPAGIGITRVVAVFVVLLAPFNNDHKTRFNNYEPIEYRVQFSEELESLPGKHLVIVHYAPQHVAAREWVYNGADIDNSKIVWARDIPGVDLQPLFEYFRGRQVWVAEPDANPPRLTPYEASVPSRETASQSGSVSGTQ